MSDKDKTGPRNAARREMLKRVGVGVGVAGRWLLFLPPN